MKYLLVMAFAIGTIWDGLTTLLGLGQIIGAREPLQYVLCGVAAILVLAFTLGTKFVLEAQDFFGWFMKTLWGVAILFDIYTSFTGNAQYVVLHVQLADVDALIKALTSTQWLVIGALTLLVSSSPVILPYVAEELS